jgi:hypothetical protein
MKPRPVEQTSYDEVKRLHRDSDVDENPLAQHHTLGILPNQASPGDHIHDGKTSKKINLGDLQGGDIDYQPLGGTDDPLSPPTFSGDPLITGSYVRFGDLVHFQIDVDFDNITSFGAGQYYLTLPFPSEHDFLVRDGCLHDISGNDQYAITGHCNAGSSTLELLSVASNGRDVPFTFNVPVTLDVADNFHIAGTYHVQH